MYTIDADAVLWREGTGDELLVIMHGLQSDERDLFRFVDELPAELTVASIRAPIPCGEGYAWSEFGPEDPVDHSLIDQASGAVLTWLDSLSRAFSRIHLLGFSQGGAVAVQMARLAPERFASIAHLSSFVHAGELPGDAVLAARSPRLPVFTAVGDFDEVIHADKVARSEPWLDAHFDVERMRYPRAHSIVEPELRDIAAFLERV